MFGVGVHLVLTDEDLKVAQHVSADKAKSDKSCYCHEDFLADADVQNIGGDTGWGFTRDRYVHMRSLSIVRR